jgi:acyl carrier protein
VRDRALLDKIREIVADVTHTPVEKVDGTSGAHNLEAWDSVSQINIIVSVEAEFGVSFSAAEIYELSSVQKIRSALERALTRG